MRPLIEKTPDKDELFKHVKRYEIKYLEPYHSQTHKVLFFIDPKMTKENEFLDFSIGLINTQVVGANYDAELYTEPVEMGRPKA